MRGLHLRTLWLTIGLAMVTIVLVVALVPNPHRMVPWHIWDKIQHAATFCVLAAWFGCIVRPRHHPGTGLALIGLGVLIEILQRFTGYRDFQYFDILADTIGVAIGSLLVMTPLGLTLVWFERRVLHLPALG